MPRNCVDDDFGRHGWSAPRQVTNSLEPWKFLFPKLLFPSVANEICFAAAFKVMLVISRLKNLIASCSLSPATTTKREQHDGTAAGW